MDISDINKWLMLFGLLAFGIVACDGGPATQDGPGLTAAPEYLTEVIPACTPVAGSSVDPCEPGWRTHGSGSAIVQHIGDQPDSVQDFLEGALDSVPHIVIRGTYLPGTIRCTPTVFRPRPYLGPDAYGSVDDPHTMRDASELLCYADVRVNEYILGTGPTTITAVVWYQIYWDTYGESVDAPERGLVEGGVSIGPGGEIQPIVGREEIMFLGPTPNASTEALEVISTWGIEQREDGTVLAVHPYRGHYSTGYSDAEEIELPQFKQMVATAQAARVAANDGRVHPEGTLTLNDTRILPHPKLITDVHDLPKFYREVGAYDHPDGPPAQPPPAR